MQGIRISVVVPVYNAVAYLAPCLEALQRAKPADAEIIVVDDASTDSSAEIAERHGVKLLRLASNLGPATARNHGVLHSSGEIVFFVDQDVVVPPDAIEHVGTVMGQRPEVSAIFGSYDDKPQAEGVVSRYRNLLHHYTHQTGNSEASTFWSGCGAVRRSAFDAVGGFDGRRFPTTTIEDIELGYRLKRAGYRILLDKRLQATHLKCWRLLHMIHTDVICRAIPWAGLLLESRDGFNDLNLKMVERISGALVLAAALVLPFCLWRPELLIVVFAALAAVGVAHRNLYAFFMRGRGLRFAAVCVLLHYFYYLYSSLAYVYAWARFHLLGAVSGRPRTIGG